MNVETLLKEDRTHALLADGSWKRTDHYEVDPENSPLLGRAHIYTLSREITTHKEAALVYLFQRLYMDTASKKNEGALSANDLLDWLFYGGYISSHESVRESGPGSSQGVGLDPHIAWNKLQEGIRELLEKEQAHVYKNGQEIAPAMLFTDHNVKAVIAFKDYEKDSVFFDYLYFIETDKDWMYFNWGDVL
jgi:hypothetical protein